MPKSRVIKRMPETECNGKVRHESRGAADFAMRLLLVKHVYSGAMMNTYRCKFCGGWHVGNRK
jgi:hypothetical protein